MDQQDARGRLCLSLCSIRHRPGIPGKENEGPGDEQTLHQTRETISLKASVVRHWVTLEFLTRP